MKIEKIIAKDEDKIISLKDIGLTKEQVNQLNDWFEKVMIKYSRKAYINPNKDSSNYFDGVADGINHCSKIVRGIEDDYLLK